MMLKSVDFGAFSQIPKA